MKRELLNIINEINQDRKSRNYNHAQEEPLPKGYFSSSEISKKYSIHRRSAQSLISEQLGLGRLFVQFVRRRTNGLFVKRIPVYKFKNKSHEKSFKSRLKGKQQ